jgi:hypothetical protein
VSRDLGPQPETHQQCFSDKRSWDYEFRTGHRGRSECTASEAPKKYQFKTLAGDKSSWTCRYEPDGGNTELSLKVEYEEPQLRHCSSPNYRSGLATDELVRYNFAVPLHTTESYLLECSV